MRKPIFLAMLCLAALPAAADTIYKCVEGDRVSYNDRPCGKSATVLKLRAGAPAPDTLERLARERALLQEIEDARGQREEQAAREGARAERQRRAAAALQRRCDRLRLQRKWLMEDSARAGRDSGDGIERARIKARRQAEVLAVECPA